MEELLLKISDDLKSESLNLFLEFAFLSNGEFFDTRKIVHLILEKLKKENVEYSTDTNGNITFIIPKNAEGYRVTALHSRIDSTKIGERINIQLSEDNSIISENSNYNAACIFGVATMLYILHIRNEFEHGELLFIITLNDEVDLSGSRHIPKYPHFSFNTFINLNSYEGNKLSIGGPACRFINIKPKYIFESGIQNHKVLLISINDMNGGCLNGCNSSPVSFGVRILQKLRDSNIDYRIASIICGDTEYTVPRSIEIKLLIPNERADESVDITLSSENQNVMEFIRSESSCFNTEIINESIDSALSIRDSLKLTDILTLLPNGVLASSLPYNGCFETGSIIASLNITSEKSEIILQCLAMTNGGLERIEMIAKSAIRMDFDNYDVDISKKLVQWGPKRRSKIVNTIASVFKQHFHEAKIEFGLQSHPNSPSIFYDIGYDIADYISIGPVINDYRTKGESLSIAEINKWSFITKEIIASNKV